MRIPSGLVLMCLLVLASPLAFASSAGRALDEHDGDVFDKASLRRGAETYVTYCQSCHGLKLMRYSRMARDIGMGDAVLQGMLRGVAKPSDSMLSAMTASDGEHWFGVAPPDLSLVARARGADWIYSYLRGFYIDESRPNGVNNFYYPDVAMPHVMSSLQGNLRPVFHKVNGVEVIDHLERATQGHVKEAEFDHIVSDLVNFLVYVGEPSQLERLRLGKWVMLIMILMVILFRKLKDEYWKDVH